MANQRGDTIVEVLLATVLLSVVLAGAYTLSNRATNINQTAFERTQATNHMQSQAELIRASRDAFDPVEIPVTGTQSESWSDITGQGQAAVAPLGSDCEDVADLATNRINPFYVSANTARTVTPGVQQIDDIYYVWSEIEEGPMTEYWDVHVYACWEALGNDPANRSALTIRLEDPS